MTRCVVVLLLMLMACGGDRGPTGPVGPPGIQGDPGPVGAPGPAGVSGSGLVSAWSCGADIMFHWGGRFALSHAVWRFADGSVMTACEVWGQTTAIQGMNMWRPGGDAITATCYVGADVEGSATQGYWAFASLGQSVSQATYHDPGAPSDGRTFALSTCETQP